MWIKLNDGPPMEVQIVGTTARDAAESVHTQLRRIQKCVIYYHNYNEVIPETKFSDFETSHNHPLVIKYLVVYYKYYDGPVALYQYSLLDTCLKLFRHVTRRQNDNDFKLFGRCNGIIYTENVLLNTVKMSENNPMIINPFHCYYQYEGGDVINVHCNPLEFVEQFVKDNVNRRCIAFLNKTVIDMQQILATLCTSKENSVVLKDAQLDVKVDGQSFLVTVNQTIKGLMNDLSAKLSVKCKVVISQVKNVHNSEVLDLMNHIFETPKADRTLYFSSNRDVAHIHSVSEAAKKYAEEITCYSEEYELYMHWFCLKVYDQYSREPDDTAKEFVDNFKKMMKIDNYKPRVFAADEFSHTAMFFHSLDGYLFPDEKVACIIHQPVIAGKKKTDLMATVQNLMTNLDQYSPYWPRT